MPHTEFNGYGNETAPVMNDAPLQDTQYASYDGGGDASAAGDSSDFA